MQHHQPDSLTPADSFPTDPAGLPGASRPQLLELADGETLELRVAPVAKRLAPAIDRALERKAKLQQQGRLEERQLAGMGQASEAPVS